MSRRAAKSGAGAAVKKLRGVARGAAYAFGISWEHYLHMLAETKVQAVVIDLLRGTVAPPAFAIDRNEILAHRLRDQVVRAERTLGLELSAASLTLRRSAGGVARPIVEVAFVSGSRRYEARFVAESVPRLRMVKIGEQTGTAVAL